MGKTNRAKGRHPLAQRMLDLIIDLAADDYLPPEFGKETLDSAQFGAFCALLRHRAHSEFVHNMQKHKASGDRETRGQGTRRANNSTSPRFCFAVLPQEWGVLRFCLPDAEVPPQRRCFARITFGWEKMTSVLGLGWAEDDHRSAFPDNEGNPALEKSILRAISRADSFLPRGAMSARDAYGAASATGFAGVMGLPDDVVPSVVPPAADRGFVYLIPDYARDTCKIGTGMHPWDRARATGTYRTGIPVVMAVLKGGKFTESLVHRKNAKHRIDREHFRLDPVFQWLRDMSSRSSPLYDLLR